MDAQLLNQYIQNFPFFAHFNWGNDRIATTTMKLATLKWCVLSTYYTNSLSQFSYAIILSLAIRKAKQAWVMESTAKKWEKQTNK